jgi:DMSO/TMAO reductase YedYZ molybdopterin-dependent catalytic subunit
VTDQGLEAAMTGTDGARVAAVADAERSWREALAAGLVGRSKDPLNCEVEPEMLGGETAADGQFFRRNHFPMPVLDPASWRLHVSGLVRRPLALSLGELRSLPPVSVTVTLECAGNGRTSFSPAVPGERWDLGAVSTATWTGPRLADVLDRAKIRPGAREVIFRGADGGPLPELPGPVQFERSLPVPDAAHPDALLAYEMNGEPLPVAHGFPVRLVVPGWYAVASVKWLTDIVVTDEPFDGFFQDTHYVYEWRRHGRREREPVRWQRVRAMITSPAAGQRVPGPDFTVRGVAWSGMAPVSLAEVRADAAGAPALAAWQPARLTGRPSRYGARRWQLRLRGVPAGPVRLQARAADTAGNDQREAPEWNALGYGGNFVHEVQIEAG